MGAKPQIYDQLAKQAFEASLRHETEGVVREQLTGIVDIPNPVFGPIFKFISTGVFTITDAVKSGVTYGLSSLGIPFIGPVIAAISLIVSLGDMERQKAEGKRRVDNALNTGAVNTLGKMMGVIEFDITMTEFIKSLLESVKRFADFAQARKGYFRYLQYRMGTVKPPDAVAEILIRRITDPALASQAATPIVQFFDYCQLPSQLVTENVKLSAAGPVEVPVTTKKGLSVKLGM
jgi:hypothetical protein